MSSTKLMLLGILLSVMGLAVNSVVVQYAAMRALSTDALNVLAPSAIALFLAGFIVGLIGFFRH